jgi:hypothetical protein
MKRARGGTAWVGAARAHLEEAAREPLVAAAPSLGRRLARRAAREMLEQVNAMKGTP